MAFVVFIMLSVANYPKEDLAESKLRFVVAKEEELNAGKKLYELLEQFDKILDEADREMINKDFNIEMNNVSAVELLHKTNGKRSEIFEFIKSNEIDIYQELL